MERRRFYKPRLISPLLSCSVTVVRKVLLRDAKHNARITHDSYLDKATEPRPSDWQCDHWVNLYSSDVQEQFMDARLNKRYQGESSMCGLN